MIEQMIADMGIDKTGLITVALRKSKMATSVKSNQIRFQARSTSYISVISHFYIIN